MAIAIVGMLDEREDIVGVVKDQINQMGLETCVIDITIGTGAIIPTLQTDITAPELAELGRRSGIEIEQPDNAHRDLRAIQMGEGLRMKVFDLYRAGEIQGIIAVAGLTGTLISLEAMKALPFGFPKVLLSSAAAMPAYAAKLSEYFSLSDVTVMHTVFDTVGMNYLVRTLAVNGANAISGMVKNAAEHSTDSALLAITEFGFCDKGAHYIREILKKDYEIVSFHANGLGDRAAIRFVREGHFKAFIDLVPGAFAEYLLGGLRAVGPERIDVFVEKPIPYIFCPGGFDMISCGPLDRREKKDPLWVSRKLHERKLYIKDRVRCVARVSVQEMEELGIAIAQKLNQARNKELVKVVLPRKGFSSLSARGGPLFDSVADSAFITALEQELDPQIDVTVADTDINSPEFAPLVVGALKDALSSKS